MSCQSCGNTKTSWCGNCSPTDNIIAKVDTLPDPFYGDRDHLYLTPQGIIYALAPDRNSWVKVSGDKETIQFPKLSVTGGGTYLTVNGYELNASELVQAITALNNKEDKDTTYTAGSGIAINGLNEISAEVTQAELDGTKQALNERISIVEAKTDNYINNVGVSREGNKVKLTYTYVTGQEKEVEFDDKDTITLAYDDTEIKQRLSTLEQKADKDNQTLSFNGSNRELVITNGNSVVIPDKDTTYIASGTGLVLNGNAFSIDTNVIATKDALNTVNNNLSNRLTIQELKGDKNTTYTIERLNGLISLRASDGSSSRIIDNNETIAYKNSGSDIILTKTTPSLDATGHAIKYNTVTNTLAVNFARTQYIINEFYPTTTDLVNNIYTFDLNGTPRTIKEAYGVLSIQFLSLNATGSSLNSDGSIVKNNISGSQNIYTNVQVFGHNVNTRRFIASVRLPKVDIELEISGEVNISGTTLRLKDLNTFIVTGKLKNDVKYTPFKLINNLDKVTIPYSDYNYELQLTHITKFQLWVNNVKLTLS